MSNEKSPVNILPIKLVTAKKITLPATTVFSIPANSGPNTVCSVGCATPIIYFVSYSSFATSNFRFSAATLKDFS